MQRFDDRPCDLGEGVFWHPDRAAFFWFDILNRRLLSRGAQGAQDWRFDVMASAAGRLEGDRLLLATEMGLALLDLTTGQMTPHREVEADRPDTRSNDGRADRQGGFWFSTMGKRAEPGAGSIYRYYRGQVARLFDGITIPNSISFAPDGRLAYFADTAQRLVWAQDLDLEGWPKGAPRVFLDLRAEGLNPDGAVCDQDGGLWIAIWGEGAVMRFDDQARLADRVAVGGLHSSCPAFGGPDLAQMLVTTAREGIDDPDPDQGLPWLVVPGARGMPEPLVML